VYPNRAKDAIPALSALSLTLVVSHLYTATSIQGSDVDRSDAFSRHSRATDAADSDISDAKPVRIIHVVGARPNFMKAAPVLRALQRFPEVRQVLVHTGQHYDANMSGVFFAELGMPEPELNLQVGSGSHAQQTAAIMTRFEPIVLETHPDMVLVYGDVNSTVAAALVCAKLLVPVAHVEAGLRSFDRTMPEEINRMVTDQLADLLLTPSLDGNENLQREGISEHRIRFVGNVMIDTLVSLLPKAQSQLPDDLPPRYVLVTMHRPSNVDDSIFLGELLQALDEISDDLPVIFPIHPRTRQRIADFGLKLSNDGPMRLTEPLSYLQFLALQSKATAVISDSGGIQEETTYLGVPCLTVRENTERPVTTILGTNVLVGRSMERLRHELKRILGGDRRPSSVPPLWDGRAAERVADAVVNWRPKR
jgi:UDP-N-acetylglucosamine 2-epimerase (non-hydrolysing)